MSCAVGRPAEGFPDRQGSVLLGEDLAPHGPVHPAVRSAAMMPYFSSQRGTFGAVSGGLTYEVTGPFRA